MFGMRAFDRYGVGRAILSFLLRPAAVASPESLRLVHGARSGGRGHSGSKRCTYPRSGVGWWDKRYVLKGVRP
ncbi:hypothetical protein [Rhodopseudomonas palustris]|uniref:hypothetical protein n=1 Tax=Rhodopseudomonas palustris TaxID=1076 RepID=UPI0011B0AA68|nr:hypothetical protein [Rhodopseudomonas palustris]